VEKNNNCADHYPRLDEILLQRSLELGPQNNLLLHDNVSGVGNPRVFTLQQGNVNNKQERKKEERKKKERKEDNGEQSLTFEISRMLEYLPLAPGKS